MPQKLNKEGTKWRIQVRAGEQRPSEIVFGDRTEAVQREAELRAKVGRLSLKRSTGETIAEYLPKWLRTMDGAIHKGTYERYDSSIRAILMPTMGHVELTRLTSDDIVKAYQSLTDGSRGRKYSPATIRKAHNVLRAALEDAAEPPRPRIVANPASSRKVAKWLRGYTSVTPKNDLTPPPLKGVQALLTRMLTTDSGRRLYGPCLLALDTGLRRGEVLALRRDDISLDNGALEVHRAIEQTSRHGVFIKDTKRENGERTVGLTRRLATFLERHLADLDTMAETLGDRWVEEGWVFPNTAAHRGKTMGRVWLPVTFSMLLDRESEQLGLNVAMHDLRRLHATIMEHQGVPQTEIARHLGHGDTSVTQRHYLFSVEAGEREAVQAFEAALS